MSESNDPSSSSRPSQSSQDNLDDALTVGLEGESLCKHASRGVTQKAFDSIADYLQCELDGSLLDFSVLTKMNEAATQRYVELNATANEITRKLVGINERYVQLEGALSKIDNFDQSISELERAAAELDNETRNLENQFKQVAQSSRR